MVTRCCRPRPRVGVHCKMGCKHVVITYPEMSGQKSEVINSRFANQRIFPYIFP